jgi:hypothetical protein
MRPLLAAVLSLSAVAGSAQAVVFFDGVFNNADWSLNVITNATGVGSTSAGFQVLAGGNPNEYRRVRHQLVVSPPGNGAITGLHLNATAFYNPAGGAITSINYSEDSIAFAGPGNVQGGGLYIRQGGRDYIQRNPILVMPLPAFASWTPNSAPGLVASDLYEISGTGVINPFSNPDFSIAGGVMQFGFWRGNSANGNVNTEAGIDNWRVEIIPAPSAAGLLALGGLVATRRRRA